MLITTTLIVVIGFFAMSSALASGRGEQNENRNALAAGRLDTPGSSEDVFMRDAYSPGKTETKFKVRQTAMVAAILTVQE